MSLNGIDASLITYALTENYQTRSAKVYLGVLSSGAVVADPYLVFDGRMDVMTIDDNGETANIAMTAESRLIDLERPKLRRYTSDDQKLNHPNDTGFDFVASLQEKIAGVAAKVAQAISYRFIQKILIMYRNAITDWDKRLAAYRRSKAYSI